jgi:hypothetical protein
MWYSVTFSSLLGFGLNKTLLNVEDALTISWREASDGSNTLS